MAISCLEMVALIGAAVVVVGLAAFLIYVGKDLRPTRPRPESRYRGKTLSEVEERLKSARKKT